MSLKLIAAAALLLLASVGPTFAQSPPGCFPLAIAMEAASKTYQEKPVVFGDDEQGSKLLITGAAKGNWTLWRVTAQGLACLVINGEKLQVHPLLEPVAE